MCSKVTQGVTSVIPVALITVTRTVEVFDPVMVVINLARELTRMVDVTHPVAVVEVYMGDGVAVTVAEVVEVEVAGGAVAGGAVAVGAVAVGAAAVGAAAEGAVAEGEAAVAGVDTEGEVTEAMMTAMQATTAMMIPARANIQRIISIPTEDILTDSIRAAGDTTRRTNNNTRDAQEPDIMATETPGREVKAG